MEFADSLDIILNETLPTVESFVKEKKARFVGISGYPLSTMKEVIERSEVKIDCIITYCRDMLTDNTLQDFIPFLKVTTQTVYMERYDFDIVSKLAFYTTIRRKVWELLMPAALECVFCRIWARCRGIRLPRVRRSYAQLQGITVKLVLIYGQKICNFWELVWLLIGTDCIAIQQKGVELGKLALYHSINQPGSDTYLVGMNEPTILQMNLELLWNGLSESEQKIYEELKEK